MKEIERKWLIESFDHSLVDDIKYITQHYIQDGVRARKILEKDCVYYVLTIKKGKGLIRDEFETNLTQQQYTELIQMSEKSLTKTRYIIPYDNLKIEIDKIDGYDFILAEVEFKCETSAKMFNPPVWFGTEVTGNPIYINQNLAK